MRGFTEPWNKIRMCCSLKMTNNDKKNTQSENQMPHFLLQWMICPNWTYFMDLESKWADFKSGGSTHNRRNVFSVSLWCPCQCMFGIVSVCCKHLWERACFFSCSVNIQQTSSMVLMCYFAAKTLEGFYLAFLLQNDDDCKMSQTYQST